MAQGKMHIKHPYLWGGGLVIIPLRLMHFRVKMEAKKQEKGIAAR